VERAFLLALMSGFQLRAEQTPGNPPESNRAEGFPYRAHPRSVEVWPAEGEVQWRR
jgi:hypothetical protein